MVFRNELTTLVSVSFSLSFIEILNTTWFYPEHYHSKDIDFGLDLGRGADLFKLNTVCTDRSRYAQIITNVSWGSVPRVHYIF
jgi:hypothetical protein